MFCNLRSWRLNFNLDNEQKNKLLYEMLLKCCKITDTTYLLNTNTKLSIVEKFVFDIAMFHFKRLNIKYDDTKYIEFWFKNDESIHSKNMHVDCDEYDRKVNKNENFNMPFMSCITYFNNNNCTPTVITSIDVKKYNDRNLDNNEIVLSYPVKMKHICFEGGKYYHGNVNIKDDVNTERNLLILNLWDKRPTHVPYFDYNTFFFKYSMQNSTPLDTVEYNNNSNVIGFNEFNTIQICEIRNNILSRDFFKKLLYEKHDIKLFDDINNILSTNVSNDNIYFKNCNTVTTNTTNTNGTKLLNVDLPKFIQRFIFKQYFKPDVCNWIMNESVSYAAKNGGWTTTRHKNYPTTDLPVENMKNIFSYILSNFEFEIIKKIKKSYCLHDNITFDIKDIFVVKYEVGYQDHLEIHSDGSTITVNILLSDPSSFVGGGTYFEDGITANLEQGDMIMHCGKTKHSGLKITQGKRFVLVFFIEIYEL